MEKHWPLRGRGVCCKVNAKNIFSPIYLKVDYELFINTHIDSLNCCKGPAIPGISFYLKKQEKFIFYCRSYQTQVSLHF